MSYRIRLKVYTGPTTVTRIGAMTAADVIGTEHCYYDFMAGGETPAVEAVRDAREALERNYGRSGLSGYVAQLVSIVNAEGERVGLA